MKRYSIILIGLVLAAAWRFAGALEEDVYGEDAMPAFKEPAKQPPRAVVLPPYPREENLVKVDLLLRNFPFTLWIDPASLDVDEEGVIRYTAVLRAESGAENVIYEAVRCPGREYRRYAYGAQGEFHPVGNSRWQFVRPVSQDRYRAALIDGYFCPLPTGDREGQLLRKLKGRNPARHLYSDE